MGYTHYWNHEKLPQSKWNNFVEDVQRLVGDGQNVLCEEYNLPNNLPVANEDVVRFNGRGEDSHETFLMDKGKTAFSFCKTAQKPYDVYVVAVLELAKLHFGNIFKPSSDGGDEELKAGIELAKEYYTKKLED